MDSNQNKHVYPLDTNKNTEIYESYPRTFDQQSQPTQSHQSQHFLPSYTMPMSQSMPQQLMYNAQGQSMYNIMYGPQSMYRNQNNYSQPVDPWNPDTMVPNSDSVSKDKYVKYDDKLKENNANCCAPLSNVYKAVNKNFYYNKTYMDPQWFYGTNYDNQKYNELPSCSQVTSDPRIECCNKSIKSVKYCSIQKYPEPDPKLYVYQNQHELYNQPCNKITKEYQSCSQLPPTCNLYSEGSACFKMEKKLLTDQNFFPQHVELPPFDLPKIDKCEESNGGGGESDIVVEESDEEVTDESDETEKEEIHPCTVCNVPNTDTQFYVLTPKIPFTTYTQTPVREKLLQLFGQISHSSSLCSTCMSLIDTFDNLEMQLDNVKRKLLDKYKRTVEALKIYEPLKQEVNAEKKRSRSSNKYRLKTICGLHSFKCRICQKTFSLKKFYKYHMSKHKRKPSYLCEQCGCNFINYSTLSGHLRRHLNQFNIHCTKCNKGFIYKSSLQQHNCKGSKSSTFVCHLCGKIFKSGTTLKEHEPNCAGKFLHECDKCNKRFATTTKLKQHVKVHHDKSFSETCSVCGKGFIKPSDFKTHQLSHSNEKNYKCKTCNKMYKTLSNLNQHLKIHNKVLPFTCEVCQKGFLRKENLKAHLNIHNGLKPFECTNCDKKFASQKNLDAHLHVHTGTTKKKTCTICGKQISHGLQEHMRTHSNIKQFECTLCSMRFLTKGALAKHKKRKHENTDLEVL